MSEDKMSQREKFERAAHELECDDDEDRFNERLRKIARKDKAKPRRDKADEDK